VSWEKFTLLIRKEFYPMGFKEDRWSRWHSLRQRRDQSVQDYTTEFRRLAISLGVSLNESSALMKYISGLQQQIGTELRLFPVQDVSSASSIVMTLEKKNSRGDRAFGNTKIGSSKQKMKNVVASSSTTKHEQYCDYCKIKGHTKEKCWKVHPELFPKKWQKGKATTTIIQKNEPIIVDQVQQVDPSLSLMAMPKKIDSESSGEIDKREELFVLKIQVKQEVISAIIDIGSQKNLISEQLVQKLGLATTPHPKPYPLVWIHKENELQIRRQCTFKFAVTSQYIVNGSPLFKILGGNFLNFKFWRGKKIIYLYYVLFTCRLIVF
jgi:Retrotransposon gag protein